MFYIIRSGITPFPSEQFYGRECNLTKPEIPKYSPGFDHAAITSEIFLEFVCSNSRDCHLNRKKKLFFSSDFYEISLGIVKIGKVVFLLLLLS